MTPERVSVMEFISMPVKTQCSFVFRAPPLSYVSNIYYLPFAGIVWGCSILLVFIGATIIYSTYVLPESSRWRTTSAVSEVILLAAGTVTQMGTHVEPKKLSGRISTVSCDWAFALPLAAITGVCLQFALLISLLFIYTSYTANIVALLQSTTTSIRTLDDLLHSEMKFAVQDTPYNRYFFPRMKGSTRVALYQTKIAPPNEPPRFFNLTHGIDLLREVSKIHCSQFCCDVNGCFPLFARVSLLFLLSLVRATIASMSFFTKTKNADWSKSIIWIWWIHGMQSRSTLRLKKC